MGYIQVWTPKIGTAVYVGAAEINALGMDLPRGTLSTELGLLWLCWRSHWRNKNTNAKYLHQENDLWFSEGENSIDLHLLGAACFPNMSQKKKVRLLSVPKQRVWVSISLGKSSNFSFFFGACTASDLQYLPYSTLAAQGFVVSCCLLSPCARSWHLAGRMFTPLPQLS